MSLVAAGTALWLGVMTSLSPCPLATNVAAVSYLSRSGVQQRVLVQSGFYTLGRGGAYLLLALLLSLGATSALQVSQFLQSTLNLWLGPVMLLVGVTLMGWLPMPSFEFSVTEGLQRKLSRAGGLGSMALGALFALSFCPTSAVLFFGSLLPLVTLHQDPVWLPLLYGLGTALPVLLITLVLGQGQAVVARSYNRLTTLEYWLRRVAACVFIGIGLYYSWTFLIPLVR